MRRIILYHKHPLATFLASHSQILQGNALLYFNYFFLPPTINNGGAHLGAHNILKDTYLILLSPQPPYVTHPGALTPPPPFKSPGFEHHH